MIPDMKRLCEAAVKASGTLEIDYHAGYAPTEDPAGWEAIVRAVLIELREVSASMADVGGSTDDDRYHATGFVGDDQARRAFTAMIDHILTDGPSPGTR